jgi:hypothetical protein
MTVDITVTRPPVPLIWLDTWMFNWFGRLRAGILPDRDVQLVRPLFDVLLVLRDQRAILCPETGQFAEIHPRNWDIAHAKSALSLLSGGVKTYHQRIVDAQRYRAMRAYATGSTTIHIDYAEAFHHDPVRELAERDFLVRVDLEPPADQLAQTRDSNARVAVAMESLRQECIAAKITLAGQIENELDADHYVAIELINQVLMPTTRGEVPQASHDTWMKYAHLVGGPARSLGEMRGRPEGSPENYTDLLAFYRSDHFRSLPAIRIRAELYARKMIGAEVIQPSDVMDMDQISAFLPMATYLVLDKSMADKVEQAGLAERYGVQVFKARDLPVLTEELQAMADHGSARASATAAPAPLT